MAAWRDVAPIEPNCISEIRYKHNDIVNDSTVQFSALNVKTKCPIFVRHSVEMFGLNDDLAIFEPQSQIRRLNPDHPYS